MNKDKKMTLEAVMNRIGAQESDLAIIAKHLLLNSSLNKMVAELGKGRFTKESAYALAKSYAESTMGESVAEIAPLMAQERRRMIEANKDSMRATKILATQQRKFDEYLSHELPQQYSLAG